MAGPIIRNAGVGCSSHPGGTIFLALNKSEKSSTQRSVRPNTLATRSTDDSLGGALGETRTAAPGEL